MGIDVRLAKVAAATALSGSFGVDLFFALSAYLITTLLIQEVRQKGAVDLGRFYVRRILRIWPLYFGFLGLCFLLEPLILRQGMTLKDLTAFVFLSGNWRMALFGFPASVVFPLWSVSVEEQFYVVWGAVFRGISINRLPILAFGMLVVGNGVRLWLAATQHNHMAVWHNSFARLDPLAVGIFAATTFSNTRFRPFAIPVAACLVVASQILFPILGMALPGMVFGYTIPAICAGIVLIAVRGMLRGSGRFSRCLEYLGKISYGLYVFHAFSLALVRGIRPGHRPVSVAENMILALLLTTVLAALSSTFYESRFLRIKESFSPQRRVT